MHSSKQLKFYRKLFIGILIPYLLFLIYAVFFKEYYLDTIYMAWNQQKKYIESTGHNNDYLVISDSLGKTNVDATLLNTENTTAYNLSLGGGTPIEAYYSLKKYLDNGNTVKNIISIIDIRHLEYGQGLQYQGLYHQLSLKEMFEIFQNARKLNVKSINTMSDDCKFDYSYINKMIGQKIYLPQYYLSSMINGRFVKRYKENKGYYSYLISHYGSGPGFAVSNKEYVKVDHFYAHPLIDYYFEQFIKLAHDNNIKVYLIFSPYQDGSQETIDPEVEKEYFSYFKNYSDKYNNFVLADTSFWYMDTKYFFDGWHFIEEGKEPFTRHIMNKLSIN